MKTLSTQTFGTVNFEENKVFRFPHGLPGFETENQFLVIENPVYSPIVFLQSMSREDLFFITLPVESIETGYDLQLSEEDRTVLGLAHSVTPDTTRDLICLVLICLPDHGPPTANLLGPLVLNRTTRCGVQAIRDDARYFVAHQLTERPD